VVVEFDEERKGGTFECEFTEAKEREGITRGSRDNEIIPLL
jgi:hypothetical protein